MKGVAPADLVVLDRGENTSVTVHLHGATVLSWKYNGAEFIFVSEKAVFDNKKAIRGGIPVVFPQFGPWDLGPQHGFGRISRWNLESPPTKLGNDDVMAVFSLEDSDSTRQMWDHRFKVTYTLILKSNSFEMKFDVKNNGGNEFSFTCLLHTYLSVPDVTKAGVSGLKGIPYVDKVKNTRVESETNDPVNVAENYDRVYENTPVELFISNAAGGKTLILKKNNLPDTVLWNPWAEKAKAMSDFGDDEYPRMLCVEAGYVSKPVLLKPGESFHSSQELTVS